MGRDDSAWAERPCSRKWTLDDRPCPFFACGRDCQRTWAQEAGPLYALTRAVVMVLLVVVQSYLTHLLYTARRERVDEKRLKKSANVRLSAKRSTPSPSRKIQRCRARMVAATMATPKSRGCDRIVKASARPSSATTREDEEKPFRVVYSCGSSSALLSIEPSNFLQIFVSKK